MMNRQLLFSLAFLVGAAAFVTPKPSLTHRSTSAFTTPSELSPPSSTALSAATIDPTTILTDIFGAFLNTPLILAVPIFAALAVASLLAYGVVSYANPVEPDEDDK
jgi:hypothetical protein